MTVRASLEFLFKFCLVSETGDLLAICGILGESNRRIILQWEASRLRFVPFVLALVVNPAP